MLYTDIGCVARFTLNAVIGCLVPSRLTFLLFAASQLTVAAQIPRCPVTGADMKDPVKNRYADH